MTYIEWHIKAACDSPCNLPDYYSSTYGFIFSFCESFYGIAYNFEGFCGLSNSRGISNFEGFGEESFGHYFEGFDYV